MPQDNVNQEAFNVMVNHLRDQGEKSLAEPDSAASSCLYRAPNGNKCAVGCLIDDDQYRDEIEGMGADDIPVLNAIEASGWKGVSIHLLDAMQNCHDTLHPSDWEERFLHIAGQYELTLPTK